MNLCVNETKDGFLISRCGVKLAEGVAAEVFGKVYEDLNGDKYTLTPTGWRLEPKPQTKT